MEIKIGKLKVGGEEVPKEEVDRLIREGGTITAEGRQAPKIEPQEAPKAPDQQEDIYTMEVGRLKERLTEMVKILPGTMADVGRIWVMVAKALGTSEEIIAAELKEITDRMIGRANDSREAADKRFEERSSLEK